MRSIDNERGSVLVFITLVVTLLLIMVGMGMDTGQLTYVRSQGQAAVDAAALSAVSGIASGANNDAQVKNRAGAFNSTNTYVEGATNKIGNSNVTYIQYNHSTGSITPLGGIAGANGVRVALEQTNPYDNTASGTGITTPVFLTSLMRLLGNNAPTTADISVSAVAVLAAKPSLPIAIYEGLCNGNTTQTKMKLLQSPTPGDNSCWTTYLDNSTSASDVKALFEASSTCSGLPAGVNIGTLIHLNNGQQASDYGAADKLFMKDYPGGCWLVPVVKDGSSCNRSDAITDWAKICPTAVEKQGSPKYIEADVTCKQTLYTVNDALCFSTRLVREPASGM